jgi:hypothetical protein
LFPGKSSLASFLVLEKASICATLLQRSSKNKRSVKGGYIMHGEPDWSSLTLSELLEKARDFSEKAYSGNMSSYAFLMRAMERTRPGSTLGAEIVDLIDRVQKTNDDLITLKNDIVKMMSSRECTR